MDAGQGGAGEGRDDHGVVYGSQGAGWVLARNGEGSELSSFSGSLDALSENPWQQEGKRRGDQEGSP